MTKQERIEKLLHELRYEIETGLLSGLLEEEQLEFRFVIPVSKTFLNGCVDCRFIMKPMHIQHAYGFLPAEPRLKIVK